MTTTHRFPPQADNINNDGKFESGMQNDGVGADLIKIITGFNGLNNDIYDNIQYNDQAYDTGYHDAHSSNTVKEQVKTGNIKTSDFIDTGLLAILKQIQVS